MIEWIILLVGWTSADIAGMPEPLGVGNTATNEAAGFGLPNG